MQKRIREVVTVFKNLLLAILLVLPIAANAHSPLASSSPQNGETLDVPPTVIFMEFKLPAKLIMMSLAGNLNSINITVGGTSNVSPFCGEDEASGE